MRFMGKLRLPSVEPVNLRRRNFVGDINPADPGADLKYDLVKGDKFRPERSYFSIRMVEMCLAEAGNYISSYLPVCSCFLSFTYAGEQRSVPFIVGYETVREKLGKDAPRGGAQNVDFTNIYIVENVPVKADGLTMYSALCRVSDSGFARGMLDLLSDVAGVVGGPTIGTAVRTGVDISKRLGSLLGADGVTTRFGTLDGAALGSSGYRVFAGAPEGKIDIEELIMEHGQLLQTMADGSRVPLADIDYLVVACEYRETLIDDAFGLVSVLPFHKQWEVVREKLLAGDSAVDEAYKKLVIEVGRSPDLIEADRLALLTAYRSQVDIYRDASRASALRGTARRGTDEKGISVRLKSVESYHGKEIIAPLLRSVALAMAEQGERIERREDTAKEALSNSALGQTANSLLQSKALSQADTSAISLAAMQVLAAAVDVPVS